MARDSGVRRRWALAAGVVAAVMTLSSASWACTVFMGKMTIVGKNSSMVTVIGANASMAYCGNYPLGKAKVNRGGSVLVTVKKAGPDGQTNGCNVPGSSKLRANTYDVNYTNGRAYTRSDVTDKSNHDGSRDWEIDCMSGAMNGDGSFTSVRIGTMTVDSLGKGQQTVTIPATGVANGPTDESAICVSEPMTTVGGQFGLQAPLTVL